MNLDISVCDGKQCDIKDQCKRFEAFVYARKIKYDYPLSQISSTYCLKNKHYHFYEKEEK